MEQKALWASIFSPKKFSSKIQFFLKSFFRSFNVYQKLFGFPILKFCAPKPSHKNFFFFVFDSIFFLNIIKVKKAKNLFFQLPSSDETSLRQKKEVKERQHQNSEKVYFFLLFLKVLHVYCAFWLKLFLLDKTTKLKICCWISTKTNINFVDFGKICDFFSNFCFSRFIFGILRSWETDNLETKIVSQ